VLNFLLKAGVSLAIFAILFYKIPFHELKPYISSINLGWFALSIIVQLLGALLAALRWSMIMNSLKFVASKTFYIQKSFIGVMFNQILPTSIGGDAYKILAVSKLNRGKKMAVMGVLIDRLYGLAGLILINVCSLPIVYHLLPPSIFWLIILVNMGFFLGLALLISIALLKLSFKHFSLKPISDLAHELAASVSSYKDFFIKIILAGLPNLITLYSFVLIAYAAHIHTSFADLISITPSTILLMMVPISLGGWGVREGAMVFLGGLIGLTHPEALALSLLFGFNNLLTSIPGLYLYLRSLRRR